MMKPKRNAVSRRATFGLPFGLAALVAAPAFGKPDDFDRLEALVKMRGSVDGAICFNWIKGIRYAQVGHEIKPMCGLLNCTITRHTRLSPDSFDMRLYELSFYTNESTGQYQPKLQMPFTGKHVDVPLYRTGPGQHIVKTANHEVMSWNKNNTTSEAAARMLAPDGKIYYDVELSEPTIRGDHVWLTTESTTRLEPLDPSNKPWFYKEIISHRASRRAVLDPATAHVDSASSYTLVMSWRPWMQMGDLDGRTLDHAIGGRVMKMEELPAEILSHMRQHHPDVVADPARWLEPSPSGKK